MTDSNKKPNKLIHEKSPYLLQHAYNPVDWHPWGEAAFKKAREEDKPVFLSIGYSTCHWCHVMERETFEDETAARALNDGFVSIKVDREERPDIDHIYMDVCLAMTGGGGWPLSVFLDAEGRPFFAGTYFTNAQFIDLLVKIRDLWENGREKLSAASDSVQKFLDARTLQQSDASDGLADGAYSALAASFDSVFGGFSDAPKFPSPHLLLFLMRYAAVRTQPRAMEMVAKMLDAMDRGGIHDHIGGGFCRYSTDRRWLAPHFEKMLYDNALLAYTYAQAYRQTGEARFKETAKSTFAYLERVMQSPSGGFYTAEDADSEGVEGKFYLWTKKEIEGLLGGGAGEFCRNFDITEAGNFEGKNIPNLIGNPLPLRDLPGFERDRAILFAEREKRVHPFLDDKVLSCWNGLCMAAFAFAGRTLEDPALTHAAGDIWRFIHKNMTDGQGGLLSSWREGEAKNSGHADDYAYVLWGLLELFAADGDMEVLSEAVRLNGVFMDRFTDEETGALFFADKEAGKLIARTRTGVDGAVPSANSVQAANLFTLFALTGDLQYMSAAGKILSAFAGEATKSPAAYAHMMSALLMRRTEEARVVVAGKTIEEMGALLSCARRAGALAVPVAADKDIPENLKEYFGAYAAQGGKSAAYVCRGRTCLAPVTGTDALAKLLEKQ